MKKRNMLKISLIVGIGMLPIWGKKPGMKKWPIICISNAVASHIINHSSARSKMLRFPIKLAPSSVMHGFVFALPQVIHKYCTDKKRKILKFTKGWTWIHYYSGAIDKKLSFRRLEELLKQKL